MKRFILAIIASVILGFVTTRCSSFSTRAEKEDEKSKEDVVIPRISEAEPSELKSPFQGNGDAVERTSFEDSWSLERIVSGNPSIFEEDLSADVPSSPSRHEESTNLTLVNRQTDQLPSVPSHSDSLRDILKGRADQIRRKVEGIEKKSGTNDFYEDSFSPVSFIKCTVLRGGKFKSGDRITLRALESVSMGGIAVTKHDLIEGYCTVEDRVQITVHRINGRAVNIKGFDMDGMEGLWYSDQSTEDLSSLSDEIVRDGSSLLSTRVGRIARGIASAGVETISRRRHSVAVEIPSGYELMLGYKQQQ